MSMQSGAGSGGGVMTPVNPIVGGTSLRIPAIQSPNYVHGSTGWAIFADGTAEFAGLLVNGGTIVLAGSDGSQVALLVPGARAELQVTPPTVAGITWVPGLVEGFAGPPYPPAPVRLTHGALALLAPVDAGGGHGAGITLFGGIAADVASQILQQSDQVYVTADSWNLAGNTGAATTAGITGDLTVSGTVKAGGSVVTALAARAQRTTTVSGVSTETVTDTVVLSSPVAGQTYRVRVRLLLSGTVTTDEIAARIREDSLTGTQGDGNIITVGTLGVNSQLPPALLEYYWTAPGSPPATKTFVATIARFTGTGTVAAAAGGPAATNLTVERVA